MPSASPRRVDPRSWVPEQPQELHTGAGSGRNYPPDGFIMEGKSMGVFHVSNVKRAADVINYCMRGFEVPYISGRLWRVNTKEEIKQDTQKMVFGALGCIDKF